MSLMNLITLLLTGAATVLPQMISVLPHEWQAVASGFIATMSALLHLYAQPPTKNGSLLRP